MFITNLITTLGLNPADFTDEIKSLGDKEWIDHQFVAGIAMKVYDIEITPEGEKLFCFYCSHLEQRRFRLIGIWWKVAIFKDGKWKTIACPQHYENMNNPPDKDWRKYYKSYLI
jgi:hypothetical protein